MFGNLQLLRVSGELHSGVAINITVKKAVMKTSD